MIYHDSDNIIEDKLLLETFGIYEQKFPELVKAFYDLKPKFDLDFIIDYLSNNPYKRHSDIVRELHVDGLELLKVLNYGRELLGYSKEKGGFYVLEKHNHFCT